MKVLSAAFLLVVGLASCKKEKASYAAPPVASKAEEATDGVRVARKEPNVTDQWVALSDRGDVLAAHWNKSVHLFDLHSGKRLRILKPETEDPFALVFSSDGQRLLASGWEKLRIWDVKTGRLIASRPTRDNPDCAGFSSDGRHVFFGDEYTKWGQRELKIYDRTLETRKLRLRDTNKDCRLSRDRRAFAIASFKFKGPLEPQERVGISIFNLDKPAKTAVLLGEKASPYDDDMFFHDSNTKLLVRDHSTFHLWDIPKRSVLRTWDASPDLDVDEMAYAAGTLLVVGDDFRRQVWRLSAKPGAIRQLEVPKTFTELSCVALNGDASRYAVVARDEKMMKSLVAIFSTGGDKLLHRLEVEGYVPDAHFTGDYRHLVLTSYPIRVLDLKSGKIKRTLKSRLRGPTPVYLSPDPW